MKKNKNFKVIGALVLTLIGFLFGQEQLQDFDVNYNGPYLNKLERFLSIFDNPYEVNESSIYYEIDKNPPNFSEEDLKMGPDFAHYSNLDHLNRVGPANALLSRESMPKESRIYRKCIPQDGIKSFMTLLRVEQFTTGAISLPIK